MSDPNPIINITGAVVLIAVIMIGLIAIWRSGQ